MAIANDWKDIASDAFMFARYAKEDFDPDDCSDCRKPRNPRS